MYLFDTDFTNFHRLICKICVKKINHGLLNGLSYKGISENLCNSWLTFFKRFVAKNTQFVAEAKTKQKSL
jgi:hypothetical protein